MSEEVTFLLHFYRYEYLNKMDYFNWLNCKNVRLVLRKLGAVKYKRYVNYTLPKKSE